MDPQIWVAAISGLSSVVIALVTASKERAAAAGSSLQRTSRPLLVFVATLALLLSATALFLALYDRQGPPKSDVFAARITKSGQVHDQGPIGWLSDAAPQGGSSGVYEVAIKDQIFEKVPVCAFTSEDDVRDPTFVVARVQKDSLSYVVYSAGNDRRRASSDIAVVCHGR